MYTLLWYSAGVIQSFFDQKQYMVVVAFAICHSVHHAKLVCCRVTGACDGRSMMKIGLPAIKLTVWDESLQVQYCNTGASKPTYLEIL